MILRDLRRTGGSRAVTYDSRDPIDRTLASLRHQPEQQPDLRPDPDPGPRRAGRGHARQHRQPAGQADRARSSASSSRHRPSKEGAGRGRAVLNLWCAEGVRAVKLAEVQRLRFANPVIENEFRRALETLALSPRQPEEGGQPALRGRGQAEGGGRLRGREPDLEDELPPGAGQGTAKPYLQGWAVVENPTDEDWTQGDDGPGQRAGRSRSRWTCTTRCTSPGRPSSRSCSPACGRRPTAARWTNGSDARREPTT